MEFAKLFELLNTISFGTKLHIGVLFFGQYGNESLIVPYERQIHTSPLCAKFKSTARGYRRCFRCRNMAIRKAITGQKSFGGICVNGVYEYTRAIVENGETVGIIYIGNMLPKNCVTLHARISECGLSEDYTNTLEKSVTEDDCKRMADVIESYIRMLVALVPKETVNVNSVVENLKNYVLADLEYPLNLQQIATAFHYNAKYLGRLFKQKIGCTLSEFVNKNRVERAKTHLLQSDERVIEIAYKTGFETVTYFNRIFKRYTGVSPIEYRKAHKKSVTYF